MSPTLICFPLAIAIMEIRALGGMIIWVERGLWLLLSVGQTRKDSFNTVVVRIFKLHRNALACLILLMVWLVKVSDV